jgi:hypothetical protein
MRRRPPTSAIRARRPPSRSSWRWRRSVSRSSRVVIEPGPFFCNDVWPGAGVEVPCYAPAVQPGQFMHAWVSFAQSTQVAAVMLGRDLPLEIGSPPPSPPPWTTTLVTVEVPPAGWSMP